MIYTSSHNNYQEYNGVTYSISGNRGKSVNYQGPCYPSLAPNLSFWQVWKSNIGKISQEENTKYYIEHYWREVLSKLNPEEVYQELDHSILLCYEDNDQFCHRHIVAAWLELLLDVKVPEVKIINNKIKIVNRPDYIKLVLEKIMKSDLDMKGFNYLRVLYLFNKCVDGNLFDINNNTDEKQLVHKY